MKHLIPVFKKPAAGHIAGIDQIAMMAEGRIQAFGPKAEVLQKVMKQGGLPTVQRQAAMP
jgi:ATP-binding cassette subfamily C protein